MADIKGPGFDPLDDLKALFFFFTALWFFWLITGGPADYEARQKPFLKAPSPLDTGEQYGSLPELPSNTASYSEPDAGDEVAEKQGVFGKPIIYLKKGNSNSEGRSYITLEYPTMNMSMLNVSELTLRNLFGQKVRIGNASLLPYQGEVNYEDVVSIAPGTAVYLVEDISPIGVSFRVNKCMGYLAQFQNFYPALSVPVLGGRSTYNNCVGAHQYDSDFYNNVWYIYLGDGAKLWSETGDLVRIIDNSGRTLGGVFY